MLSEFRSRLVEGKAERLLLDTLLQRLRDKGLVKAKGRQRTDSTHVLAAVRGLNRLERVGETVRAALNELAVVAPDWLQALAPPVWFERYSRRVENYLLPKSDTARLELATAIGADGSQLLAAVDAAVEQPWLAQLPATQVLRQVWETQYVPEEGHLRWRTVKEMPPAAEQICSPYDPDARYSTKRDISWVGYRAHFSETCDPEAPHVITNVETTPATTPDDNMLTVVHKSMEKVRCCHPSIWSTRATRTHTFWSIANGGMVSPLSVPSPPIPVGRPAPATDSPRHSFRSIGINPIRPHWRISRTRPNRSGLQNSGARHVRCRPERRCAGR